MEINQLLSGFITGDAISNYSLELQDILKKKGYQSNIYSLNQNISVDGRAHCKDYRDYTVSNKEDITIFHFSIGSGLTEYFRNLPTRKILIYHNMTPPEYFESINKERAQVLKNGKNELRSLIDCVDLALGVSEYNRKELEESGFKRTGVLNLILNERFLSGSINESLIKKYSDNYTNFISVGRLTPNKRLEDVIKLFYYYKKTINSNSRLFLIGSIVGASSYVEYLRGLTAVLRLSDVVFAGHVNEVDLRSYYKLSDLFISMSEHEGFCVPLLEGMYYKIPVMAYNSSAIPEILGDSGILIKEKKYPELAELADMVLTDNDLRSKIIEEQNNRLSYFNKEKTAKKLIEYINGV